MVCAWSDVQTLVGTPRAAVVRVRTWYHARRVRVRAMPAVGSARSWVCKVTNLSRMFSRSDGSGDFLIVLPNGVRLVRCANASWHPRAAVVRFMISCHARRVRVPCARSSWRSARPRVEAQDGRHRDSVLTDFAGINGGFDHRSNILAPHRHAARTLAWLWCHPDVRARRRCAGDALLPGKDGYYVLRRAQGGDIGIELLVQTYGKTYGSLPIKNKSEHIFQSNHFQT
jgi:hypothetical protein